MEDYKGKLAEEYSNYFALDKNKPPWAVKKKTKKENIHPAIPFVGKSYANTRLLLYTDIEISTYNEKHLDMDLFEDDKVALYRRDVVFDSFFPNIQIPLVNNGTLLVVAAYILQKMNIQLDYLNPAEFIEQIAIDIFCKFPIRAEFLATNLNVSHESYQNDMSRIEYSFKYVEFDLKILQPEILVLPKSIYANPKVKQFLKSIVPRCLILPIYRMNRPTINKVIAKKYQKKYTDFIDNRILYWQYNLDKSLGENRDKFYSVYTYLDDIIKEKRTEKNTINKK